MVGDKIREYEIIAGPFNGAYGTVCVCQHTTLGLRRAIKQLHPHIKPEVIRDEALKQKTVLSPYVVQIHDFWEAPPAIVMEYCPIGLDRYLRDRLAATDGRIPYEEARELLHDILQGLNDAHKAGLTHGDIKPGNIRFGIGAAEEALGLPRLADFGAASRLREQSPAVRGSTNWMAPELIGGHPATPACDYFSFGVLAYLVFSGRHPYFADDPSCLTSEEDLIVNPTFVPRHLAELRSDMPAGIADLVMELLSRDPQARERAELDLKAALSPQSGADELVPVAALRPPQMSEQEWAALNASYDEARRRFFAEYQPKAAVAIIDQALADVGWQRLSRTRSEPIANCWSLRAFINNSEGLFAEAVEAATHGLEVDSDHVNSLHARAYAYIQLGRYKEAAEDLTRALALAEHPTKRKQIRALLATVHDRGG